MISLLQKICAPLIFFLLFPGIASAAEEKSYIVLFKDSVNLKGEISDLRETARVPRVYDDVFKGANALLAEEEKERLALDPAVRLIEEDGRAYATRATSLWGLDRIDQRSLPLDGGFLAAATGAGVKSYVVDTGLRADHREFTGRVLSGYTSISDGRGTSDCDGHGTHVAGTVAGTTYGVAPGSQIVPVRVLDCEGSGSWSGVIAGLDWIAADHDPGEKAVANMSLGGGYVQSVNDAVARLVADGVAVAVAAGNEGSNACSTSPASTPNAITVGSTTILDAKSGFSNTGSCLDIFAPGSNILSASITSTTASESLSGTSMASPHVAGAAALLLEDSDYTPAQIVSSLTGSATAGVITNPGANSPNKLLYAGADTSPPPPPPSPPENDNFLDAEELTIGSITGSSFLATKEAGEPTHVNSQTGSGASIWYHWKPETSGELTLDTNGSAFDTLLAVYEGTDLAALSVRAANDDGPGGGLTSRLTLRVIAERNYRIVVDGFRAASGNFNLFAGFVSDAPAKPVIDSGPPAFSTSPSATFSFFGEATFQCSLDLADWSSCTSPITYQGLLDGDHVFSVRSINAFGQTSEARVYEWNIDQTPPSPPALTSTPGAVSDNPNPSFAFSGESEDRFQCSLDNKSFSSCSSPKNYSALSYGDHLFRVRESDEFGNVSQDRSFSWRIIPIAPRIVLAPPRTTESKSAAFSFAILNGATVFCSLDSSSWRNCSSGSEYRDLNPGEHTFRIRQVVNDVSSAIQSYTWTITSPLARPTITNAPSSGSLRSARFLFRGVKGARFQCKLNRGKWSSCFSPKKYSGLARRKHTFRVRQIKDESISQPAVHRWTVRAPRPR